MSKNNNVIPNIHGSFNNSIAMDQYFDLIKECKIVIPQNYNYAIGLTALSRLEFREFNDNLTDENYKNVTNILQPGKEYIVKVFKVKINGIESQDCLNFLKAENAVLVGAQGASFLYQVNKEMFLPGKWTLSFDREESLFKDSEGEPRVPCLLYYPDSGYKFLLCWFRYRWDPAFCFLCFRKSN